MELFGGLPLPFSLALLALIDGLSVGTLLIPVFLLLHPGRVHARRILLYLILIGGFIGGGILGGLGYAHWHYRALLGAGALAASLALVYLLYWRWQNRRDTTY